PSRADLPADAPVISERRGRVIRSARQLAGGVYARWQDLLDRNDVPGLVTFAGSPDALGFRSTLVGAMGRDLLHAKDHRACQAYLRAAVDRYAHDIWLHTIWPGPPRPCRKCSPHSGSSRPGPRTPAASSATPRPALR